MKTHPLLAGAVALLTAALPVSAKNFVYKGTFSSTDLTLGTHQSLSLYFIVGDRVPITGDATNYSDVSTSIIILGGAVGPKRYVTSSLGKFKELEVTKMVNDKPRVNYILHQASTQPADVGGAHSLNAFVLTGHETSSRYHASSILTGTGLVSYGTSNSNAPATGSASKSVLHFNIVTALTDPIPDSETLDQTVQRVKDSLAKKGYIEFVP